VSFLNAENHAWRERARDVAERVVRPLAAQYDREQTYPWEIKEAIADAGLLRVWIPKQYGGDGAGVLNLCICVEELSRACGGVGVMYAVTRGGLLDSRWRTEAQKKNLPLIATGEAHLDGLSRSTPAATRRACAVAPSRR
jgi:alkylation response protein AidB-like acyl-CoA dehydrogenase